jgi:translation initiation factor 5A
MVTQRLPNQYSSQASVVGADIFTNKKYEDSFPTSHNVDVPFVKKKEY